VSDVTLAITLPSGRKHRAVHVELPGPAFDPLVTNPGRLRILTELAAATGGVQDFVRLRFRTGLTDGNLATHVRRLTAAGLVSVEKTFRDGKPLTRLAITPRGRDALRAHVDALMAAIEPLQGAENVVANEIEEAASVDDWVD
jgi:DNA-binding MarR family transcriptional regulator